MKNSREYIEIPKTRKRIRLVVEKHPYIKRKKLPKKTYEEKLFDEAKEIKSSFLGDKRIMSLKMSIMRTTEVYNDKRFKRLVEISKTIRKSEMLSYLMYCVTIAGALALCYVVSLLVRTQIPILFSVLAVPLAYVFCLPKVKFKTLFKEVYLPICYHCANVSDISGNDLKFELYDKKEKWNKKAVNEKLITNKFAIKTSKHSTIVEKMVIRNYITTYKMVKGNLHVGKKLATIFSGYSFDLDYPVSVYGNNDKTMDIAIINDGTFLGTNGISQEEIENFSTLTLRFKALKKDWKIYVRNGLNLTTSQKNEIQKKVMMISNEIGAFNAYISEGNIKMLFNVQLNKNGLKEEFFQTQLKNPESLNFNGFFSIVKTLYVLSCIDRISKIIYGRKDEKLTTQASDFQKLNKKQNSDVGRKTVISNKNAEIGIDSAIKIIISVVLCSALLAIFIPLLDNSINQKNTDNMSKIYSEQTKTVTVNDLEGDG